MPGSGKSSSAFTRRRRRELEQDEENLNRRGGDYETEIDGADPARGFSATVIPDIIRVSSRRRASVRERFGGQARLVIRDWEVVQR